MIFAVTAAPDCGLLDPQTAVSAESNIPPRVTPAEERPVIFAEFANLVAEGMLVARCGVVRSNPAVLDLQASIFEAGDGVFETHVHSGDVEIFVGIGGVLEVGYHCIGAAAEELWLGRLARVVGFRWSLHCCDGEWCVGVAEKCMPPEDRPFLYVTGSLYEMFALSDFFFLVFSNRIFTTTTSLLSG